MKNIVFKTVKVWLLSMRDYVSIMTIIETIIESLIYFTFVNVITKNIYVSLSLLFLIIFSRYVYNNVINLKSLINTDNFGYFLLKPINPIYRLAIFGTNPTNLILGLAIILLLVVNFPQYLILILSVVTILFAFYIFNLSITLFAFNTLSVEKIFTLLVLISLIFVYSSESLAGLTATFGQLSLLVFSISLLFLSIKLWNHSTKNF